jgi:hypothetical protein
MMQVQISQPLVPLPALNQVTDVLPKCADCSRTLGGYFTRPWCLICRRCGAVNDSDVR